MAVKRGDAAREAVRQKIIDAFGSDYVDTVDKKIYVYAEDGQGGERIQFAITMTMPKTPIGSTENAAADPTETPVSTPTKLSDADRAAIDELKVKLGIS